MKVSIKKGSNKLQNKLKRLHQVNGQWVQVGHFNEQGKHYSGYTFAQLAALYHMGKIAGQPARRILDALFFYTQNLDTQAMKRVKKYWLQNLNTKDMLETMGMLLGRREQQLFGKVNQFMPPDKDGTPLLEEGDLRDAVAYKTSLDPVIRGVT